MITKGKLKAHLSKHNDRFLYEGLPHYPRWLNLLIEPIGFSFSSSFFFFCVCVCNKVLLKYKGERESF